MKRIVIDMDDVMADATGQLINFYEQEFGVRVTRESLNSQEEGHGFPRKEVVKEFPYRERFFLDMEVKADCQEVMAELNKKYEVFIVSAAMEFPQSLSEKLTWLKQHFPFLSWRQIVFCGSKTIVHGDYMIDDLPRNLEWFNGEKFLFTAPHNTQYQQYPRFHNWKEVGEKFLSGD